MFCALALLLVGLLPAGAGARTGDFSTTVAMHITYNPDCTFVIHIDGTGNGITIPTDTTTIPPGTYQVQLRTPMPDNMFDPATCRTGANFSLTGPGVTYGIMIGANGFTTGATFQETFLPSSTYVAVDLSRPSDSQISFSTAATGTPQDLLGPIPVSTTPTGPGTTQADIVGSGLVSLQGTLEATVAPTGQATLASGGQPLSAVQAGKYKIVVQDKTAKSGFFVQKLGQKALTISGTTFVGKRTVNVSLTPGTWMFYSQAGKTTRFLVSA